MGYMYSWPGIFFRGEITVLCKRNDRKICRNQLILANFDDQIAKFCFRQKSGQNFSPSIVLMSAKICKKGDESKQNFAA